MVVVISSLIVKESFSSKICFLKLKMAVELKEQYENILYVRTVTKILVNINKNNLRLLL